MESFKEWLEVSESFEQKRHYKKRRPGSITGAAKAARQGSGIAKSVNPANLSKAPNSNPAGQTYNGMTIGGPDYKTIAKIHKPFIKKPNYLPNPFLFKK